jgi:enamine deaminase RidA (YjgF/YER057c/UK114 family)
MGRELHNPPDLHPAPGFSHIAAATGSRLVFIAGQVALDQEFNVVGGDDLGAQTRAAMENVGRALAAVGAGWDDVVRRTVYTKQPTEWEVIAKAIEEVQGSDRNPAQTVLGVTGLALPELLIEIECTVSL